MSDRWDVSMSEAGTGGRRTLKINLPVALSVALIERGFNRAILEVAAEGILVRPYKGEGGRNLSLPIVDLPESWDTGRSS